MFNDELDLVKKITSSISEQSKGFNEQLKKGFEEFSAILPSEPEICKKVGYDELIEWFTFQPKHPDVVYGVIARAYGRKKIFIIQVFLDKNKRIIKKYQGQQYGRKIVAESLDAELVEAFGSHNVIIVE